MQGFKKVILNIYEKFKGYEFSKKLAVFMFGMMVVSFLISVILSVFNKDPLTEITVNTTTVCGGYLCTYGLKSAFEKHSRNKYGIDESGIPYEYMNTTDYENETGGF